MGVKLTIRENEILDFEVKGCCHFLYIIDISSFHFFFSVMQDGYFGGLT